MTSTCSSQTAAARRSAVPFLVAGPLVLVAAIALAAPGFHTDIGDPNDTKGALDVRRVRLDHQGGTEVTVITFAEWSAASIWDRGNAYVFLDTGSDDAPEYFVVVRSTGADLQASLWRDRRDGRDLYVRNAQVRRKSSDGVSVALPIKSLKFGPSRESYYWWATTSFTGRMCRRTCVDRAPDDGSVEQWRPGMSPSATPPPSPSPSVAGP